MATKAKGDGCYARALPDEPIFTLLARDPRAPDLVRAWANSRALDISIGARPESDNAQLREAFDCADAMETWRKANDGKWRDGK